MNITENTVGSSYKLFLIALAVFAGIFFLACGIDTFGPGRHDTFMVVYGVACLAAGARVMGVGLRRTNGKILYRSFWKSTLLDVHDVRFDYSGDNAAGNVWCPIVTDRQGREIRLKQLSMFGPPEAPPAEMVALKEWLTRTAR